MLFEGNMNKEIFIEWLIKFLIKTLVKVDIVVLDNVNFYKYGIIKRLLKKTGCGLLYLPLYSPDLNPI